MEWQVEISNTRSCCRRSQKKKAGLLCLPWRIPDFGPAIVLPQLFFGLEAWISWWQWIVEDVGCNVDRLMPQNVAWYSNPGYVERSWRWFNEFKAEVWSFLWRYRWPPSGALKLFFRSEIWEIYLFEPRKFKLWLASSILLAFLTLNLPSTVALGLNFECSVFLEGWNVSHVQSMALGFLSICSFKRQLESKFWTF